MLGSCRPPSQPPTVWKLGLQSKSHHYGEASTSLSSFQNGCLWLHRCHQEAFQKSYEARKEAWEGAGRGSTLLLTALLV